MMNCCPVLTFGVAPNYYGDVYPWLSNPSAQFTDEQPINISALVYNGGTCPRSGAVQFQYLIMSTGAEPVVICADSPITSADGSGPSVQPGQYGVTTYVWTPYFDPTQTTSIQLIGTSYAPNADGPCPPIGLDQPSQLSTYTTSKVRIYPPSSSPAVARSDRAVPSPAPHNTLYVGFGVPRTHAKTQIGISVFRQTELFHGDVVAPEASVTIVPATDPYASRIRYSGTLSANTNLELDRLYTQSTEVPECSPSVKVLQGIAKIVWPTGSEGKRALFEVKQFLADDPTKTVGAFVVGVRNAADPTAQGWL